MRFRSCLRWYFLFLSGLVVLTGCTATKYLGEDQSFYAGSAINFDPQGKVGGRKEIERDLMTLIAPAPNTKVLGMRPGVWLYFRQRDNAKKKGLKAFIRRKFGQAPILMSDIKPEKTAALLEGQLHNDGYFKSAVQYEVKERRKESKVIYKVLLYPPYRVRTITYPSPRDSIYARIIESLKANSLLKPGQRYELARLQAEQARIENEVKNFGVFFFDDRYLIFEADSTVGERQVDLQLKLEQGIPEKARRIYDISEIDVFPDFSLDEDTLKVKQHITVSDSMNYHDVQQKFRPNVITDVINLRKNNIYTSEDHSLTLSHLMDLGVFKFVNIRYTEVHPDSSLLRSSIFLIPLKKMSLRGEFQGVSKSNSFAGPGLELTFTNRNLFRGAELFKVKMNASYEVQLGQRVTGPLNSFEFGGESSITVPRFITPFRIDYSSRRFLPKTDFRLGFSLQSRVNYFRLNSFNLSAGYQWRESEAKSHELLPIDVMFVQTRDQSPEFQEILQRNRFLESSFQDQFIIGSRYSYTLNTQLKPDLVSEFRERKYKTHSLYLNAGLQLAGNLLNFVQKQAHKNEEGPFKLLNSAYSQFTRADFDFRHYWQLDEHNKLASRLSLGVGYAYGNSEVMPYIRQFAVGGSNSIRAFPARSVGPGTYYVVDDTLNTQDGGGNVPMFIDQRGDIKLEANVELRFDIIKAFKGAVFIDAGNIWLWREDPQRPGGQFDKDRFYHELAIGTGAGFRFDLNFFVLRLDVAFPVRKPNLPPGTRWVLDNVNFGDPTWRKENLIFNIAIGYPF